LGKSDALIGIIMIATNQAGRCFSCVYFRNDPAYLESVFKGLSSLGSGYGSARADDGICMRHERYLSARSSCAEFCAAGAGGSATRRDEFVAVAPAPHAPGRGRREMGRA
jgi:hypothetical protein